MDKNEERAHWLERLNALGRLQARYLWFLIIAAVFYWQLRLSPRAELKVPIIDLFVDTSAVLEAGAFVLCFLVLVELGAARAYSVATEKLGFGFNDPLGEATDKEPNFLDMAFYTAGPTRGLSPSPTVLKWIAHLKYPAFFTLVLAEAVWLLWGLWPIVGSVRRTVFAVLGLVAWLVAAWRVGEQWRTRFRNLRFFGRHF